MPEPTTGVIHDIGYQRYDGPRLGRGYIARSLYTHGVRTAFGIGRGAKAKIFPWLVVGLVGAVAAVVTAVRAQSGQALLSYAEFSEAVTLLLVLFCAVVAPELVSRDLRSGVLPVYFSRPLRPGDYGTAKLAALVSAVFLPVAGSLLVMFTGAAFGLDEPREIWDEAVDLLSGLGYAGVRAVVFSAIALLVASLIGRRAVAAAVVVAVFLVTTPVVGVLFELGGETGRQLSSLASPVTLVDGVGVWLFDSDGGFDVGPFGPLYGGVTVALVATCVLLILVRYRRIS